MAMTNPQLAQGWASGETGAQPLRMPAEGEPPPMALDQGPLEIAWQAALARWRLVALLTVLAGILGVPISLSLPLWYAASVRLIPAPVNAGGATDPSMVRQTTDDANSDSAPDLGRLLSILHSRSLTDDTIQHFDLAARYHAHTLDDMRERFWGQLATLYEQSKEDYVELKVEDRNPRMAAEIANYMAGEANEISRRITSASAAEQRRFLQKRLEEVGKEVQTAADAYKRFQEKNKLVDLNTQADAAVGTLLRLKDQLIQNELKLQQLRSYASEDDPGTSDARRKVRELREKLQQLEEPAPDGQEDFFTRLDEVPGLRVEAERLSRELKTKTSLYDMLVREFELARLAEVRDTRSYALLDSAVVPRRKSRPSRTLAVLAVAGIGFMLSMVGCGLLGLRRTGRKGERKRAAA